MWCHLRDREDFGLQVLRQQFSKKTDPFSEGRQMVYHLHMMDTNILPVQSAVGMQLGKAAGYARGFQQKGITDGVAMAVIGDGSTAEGDMHDAMTAASVWSLPVIYIVTDNEIAISTTPEEGRGIRSFETYANAFGVKFFDCDGRDFWDVYETTVRCAQYVKDNQKPALIHAHHLPRFNGHSSAADVTYDLTQDDPLIAFGQDLVERGLLTSEDVLKRIKGEGRDFFAHHELGAVMGEEDVKVRGWLEQVLSEPNPDPNDLYSHIYPPFPEFEESAPGVGTTSISYAGAIRSALDKLITEKNGVLVGQDVGHLGGVMQASAGLKKRHPLKVTDAPLNEPLIVGTSTGLALHPELMALPEIQFGDYSLNTLHWLVYVGNVYWSTVGQISTKMLLRMPTDPFGGGAMYHSMSLEGFYGSIPGLVIIMPSTSFDAHGLMLAAGEYDGPVMCLEPKWMYRQTLGPAFPGEPTDANEIRDLKKGIMRGEIPEIPDVRVPIGKGIIRRSGSDVTIVAWGRAVWTSLAAAEELAKEGVEAEVIDLRTIVPPDMDLVFESVDRTGRLIVAAEDRNFAGFARQIQGDVVDQRPGMPTKALGQKNIPGIGQSLILEDATILSQTDIQASVHALLDIEPTGGPAGWDWTPPRYFIG
jgi:2-oxoisovalerate dehydrogenase E1 component